MRELAERAIESGRVLREETCDGVRRRRVTVNLAESPLSWLRARGHIDARQFEAGERLRGDYEMASLGARVTMQWNAGPRAAGRRGVPDAAAATLAQISAKRRFVEAVRA